MININNFKVEKIKYYDGGGYFCHHKKYVGICGDGFTIGESIKSYKSAFKSVKIVDKKPLKYNTTLKDFSNTIEEEESDILIQSLEDFNTIKELKFNF